MGSIFSTGQGYLSRISLSALLSWAFTKKGIMDQGEPRATIQMLAQRCTCKLQKASQTMHLVAWGDEGLAVPPAAPTGECQGCAHPACAAGAPDGSRGPPRWSAPCTAAAVSLGFAGASSAAGRAEPGSPTAGCSCLTGRGAPTTSPAGPPETGEEAG